MFKLHSPRSLLTLVGVIAFTAASAAPAAAATSGSINLTIPVAIYSLTIDPAAGTFAGCVSNDEFTQTSGLIFPNGVCRAPAPTEGTNQGRITITNGGNAGHIHVQSSGIATVPNDANPKT